MKKSDFQKTIGQIRSAGAAYPKAMMTAAQAANNTATVNCGGDYRPAEKARETAEAVLGDPRFQAFLLRNEAAAAIECSTRGSVQVRITW